MVVSVSSLREEVNRLTVGVRVWGVSVWVCGLLWSLLAYCVRLVKAINQWLSEYCYLIG